MIGVYTETGILSIAMKVETLFRANYTHDASGVYIQLENRTRDVCGVSSGSFSSGRCLKKNCAWVRSSPARSPDTSEPSGEECKRQKESRGENPGHQPSWSFPLSTRRRRTWWRFFLSFCPVQRGGPARAPVDVSLFRKR